MIVFNRAFIIPFFIFPSPNALWPYADLFRRWRGLATGTEPAPSTVRPLARDLRVLIGWPFPLGFGLDGRLLLARRGRVYV